MKQQTFDEAFKPSAEDFARGDGYIKKSIILPENNPHFGEITKITVHNLDEFLKSQRYIFSKKYNKGEPMKIVREDHFKYIKALGSGAFANVSLVRCSFDGIYYARKTLAKRDLDSTYLVDSASNEMRVLNSIRHPFTVHLEYFYNDKDLIHFFLPWLPGGELYQYMWVSKRLHEREAKFVTSQILLALEYLHFIGIIHRDLKLENILIDHYGYIRVTDFGTCKLIHHERTYTLCGTAEYMAPEMINGKGYGLAADWWSFGVLVYEICNGFSPFHAKENVKIMKLISLCKYKMPKHFSKGLQSLIKNLLEIDLSKRIGLLKNGIDDIKNQNWFINVPWLAILNRQIISPIIPYVSEHLKKTFYLRHGQI